MARLVVPPAVRRELVFPPEWRTEVSRWLRRPTPRDVGPGGWIIALLPEFVDGALRFDRPALQVYQRVTWRSGLPEAVEVSVQPAWCSPVGERSELALATEATTADGVVADALLVARMDGEAEPLGERILPPRPDVDGLEERVLSLVLDREQVRTFARLAGTRHDLHDDPAAARRLGYPDVLVQGAVLLLTVMDFGGAGSPGTAEMWFRQVVPAGSVLRLSTIRRPDEDVWLLRTSTGAVAAVARLTDATCVGMDHNL
jgi:acyl dehydratase